MNFFESAISNFLYYYLELYMFIRCLLWRYDQWN